MDKLCSLRNSAWENWLNHLRKILPQKWKEWSDTILYTHILIFCLTQLSLTEFKPWILGLLTSSAERARVWGVGHDLAWSLFLGHFTLLHTRRSNVQFPGTSVTTSTPLLLECFSGIPPVHTLFFSNPTSMPPPSDSYTPDSLSLDIPATKILTSI